MKALIVEDHKESLYMLESFLGGSGYEVVSAGNGVEALKKLEENSVDIIISDILMPKMDGFQLCRECKQKESLNKIPFIFYSSIYTDKKDKEFALSLGAEKFLVKPADPDELLKILNNIIEEEKKGSLASPLTPMKDEEVYLAEYNKRLVEKLESKVNELESEIMERKKLEKALLEIEDRERRRFGQDLHDDLGQLLTAIGFKSSVLEQKLKNNMPEEADDAAKISSFINKAKNCVRRLARGISPVEENRDGLMTALGELASNTEEIFKVSCVFKCDEPFQIYNQNSIIHLYRIAQEAVTNAVRHSSSAHVETLLKKEYDKIILMVKDDGTGIPASAETNSMGLKIMNYRANMIGASLDISTDVNGGTLVTCIFIDSFQWT